MIVLPSNHSLHEDLILEELEVFKVSSFSFTLFFSLSFFYPISFPNSKAGRRRVPLDTTQRPQADRKRQGGIQEMDALRCYAV